MPLSLSLRTVLPFVNMVFWPPPVALVGESPEGDTASGIVVGIAYPLGLSERINFHAPHFDIDIRHGLKRGELSTRE